ncbi:winged helix-turn-helix transcriptional regulator [Gynurincola endophyticus]|jgi:DNA-binding HxlR family transcriptional regulator|uniref:winged helix-turn-helix transcriptional regulator n=1 Tax=Gynurincola endophyticus TaxID=2479004 RepID=UPI000F8EC1F5|nr:helix-turn-helix domain-containing protein [Gynurincola endophyticus]
MLPEKDCSKAMRSIKDALEAVEGKWKLLILYALCSGPKRFRELSREVTGITDKTLSKELKVLQENKLIKREVNDSFSQTIEYSMTEHGMSLRNVLFELWNWGLAHRKEVIGR